MSSKIKAVEKMDPLVIENQPQSTPTVKILKTGTRDIRVEELKFGKSNCGY